MDKLKENLFPVSVGAIVIALGALIWFLIVSPLMELNQTQKSLDAATRKLKGYTKMEYVPVESYEALLEQQLQALNSDLAEAAEFYDEKVKSFQLYFDDQEQAPNRASFSADLNDRINQVLAQYQSDFGVTLKDPTSPREGPPTVQLVEPALPSEIQKVMKEYWIFDEVVKACSKLEIGGLQDISYPARNAPKTYANHRALEVAVSVHLPYSKVEALLTELYSSPRALFQLQKLVYRNLPSMLEPYQELVKKKEFANRSESDAEPYDSVFPEPSAEALFTFHVVDWTGMPEDVDADVEDDEG